MYKIQYTVEPRLTGVLIIQRPADPVPAGKSRFHWNVQM